MKLRNLSYKIRDEVFPADRIVSVEVDGRRCKIIYTQIFVGNGISGITTFYTRSIECPTDEVEVLVDGA